MLSNRGAVCFPKSPVTFNAFAARVSFVSWSIFSECVIAPSIFSSSVLLNGDKTKSTTFSPNATNG